MGTESGIRNMTVGSPFRHILMFTLPLLAGTLLLTGSAAALFLTRKASRTR